MKRAITPRACAIFAFTGAVIVMLPDFLSWFQDVITTKSVINEDEFTLTISPPFNWFVWLGIRSTADHFASSGYANLAASILGMLWIFFTTIQRPTLVSLKNFADLWGLNLRKKIKALVGDYDVEIARLHKQRRYKTAQWNRILAWGYAIWYVLRGPLDWVSDYLVSAVKGR